MAIHFTFEDGDKAKVFSITGELTAGTDANLLLENVQKESANKSKKIIFDLREIYYINSTGIGMLARMVSHIRKMGGECALVLARNNVATALQGTGFLKVVPHFFSHEGALGDTKESPGGSRLSLKD
jgi:stage II sporulation protein AA (anti-sigma F factor antagonist)